MAQRTGRRMRQNETIRDYSGLTYRIEALLGEGGFGRAYLASKMSRDGKRPTRSVCLKDCGLAVNWHGEAFLGKLLADQPEVVRLIDAFVGVAGMPETRRQFLIFEYMEEGTVDDWLENSKPIAPWAEHRVRKEVRRLLLLLAKMHSVGITHRDIKPANVYLRNRRLVIGDFGISRMVLDPKQAAITEYTPAYTPNDAWVRNRWGPSEDIFQLGLLACTLLTGESWTKDDLSSIRTLDVDDDFKCWIWHATAAKAKKYVDGADALEALDTLADVNMRNGRAPTRIRGQVVTLTGKLESGTRAEVTRELRSAGAVVQDAVGDSTTLVVRGTLRNALSEVEGRKLFATRERKRLGQKITLIGEAQLLRLLADKTS
ncbi:protein kinase domain-containing protein [Williamsia muralis]|uniref:protein kinase domain-containing protein n=1 Tax=Williamsia marianensis TaxID=85044 RepID=UPI003822EE5B